MKVILLALITILGFNVSDERNQNVIASGKSQNPDFSKTVKGRFVLKGAGCAGFEFFSQKEIIWRNEITCQEADTMLLHWLDDKSFLVKDKQQVNRNKDCAPRNWYYKVLAYDGKNLDLQELWTGWGDFKTETQRFSKQVSYK